MARGGWQTIANDTDAIWNNGLDCIYLEGISLIFFFFLFLFHTPHDVSTFVIWRQDNPRDWKVSELESVRIHFLCQIGKWQNQKVSELESVIIGKCQNWKVSELESVRIGKCQIWKVSELGRVKIWKCQKQPRLGQVRNCSDWKVPETVEIGKCQKLLKLESVRNG